MGRNKRMCDLIPGESGIAVTVEGQRDLRRRLLDLGLVEGSGVTCLHRPVRGSLKAYEICGAVIAIRDCDCARVVVLT